MHQVEEISLPVTINGTLLKSECIERPPLTHTPISLSESAVAPPSANIPIAPAPPLSTSTPISTVKKVKRGFRSYLNSKKTIRTLGKPVTLLARPSAVHHSTIIPTTQQPVLLANPMTPIIQKSVPIGSTTPAPGFTTYLVFDGGQGQFVQVANDGPKPVTFRNQSGQILQATPITVVSPNPQPVVSPNPQPVVSSFPVNGDCSLLSNSSQTITTVRTSSSIDMQQQTTLTSDTTTLTTQQLTGIVHQPTILPSNSILPTTIINGNNRSTYEHNSSLEDSRTSKNNNNLSLSLSQIAQKVSHRHRRSSSSSISKKKRGRPRLYERDPFTNKPIKSDSNYTELTISNPTPISTTTYNTIPVHSTPCSSLIFPSQNSQMSVTNPSLLQQHQYSYPSLLNGNVSTNILAPSTFNTFSNTPNSTLPSTNFSYSSPSVTKEYSQPSYSSLSPTSTLPTKPTNNTAQLNNSNSNDVTVHYIGGYVIRESGQPFVVNENLHQKENTDQIRCVICQKMDFPQRFFDLTKKFCSNLCSLQSNENKIPARNEPIRTFDNPIPQQPTETNMEEQIPLPPDHGLPSDPSKWTVSQVGDFIARLTNETIREAFHESEMDGQALLLMTPEHLRETLKIKLGPSLVIASEIGKLRERAKPFSS